MNYLKWAWIIVKSIIKIDKWFHKNVEPVVETIEEVIDGDSKKAGTDQVSPPPGK